MSKQEQRSCIDCRYCLVKKNEDKGCYVFKCKNGKYPFTSRQNELPQTPQSNIGAVISRFYSLIKI